MLGIVGDSAAGKTTLVRGVVRLLGHRGVSPVCLDDYHRYSRADRIVRHMTDADPAANNLDLMAEHLATLRAGGSISKSVYDHRTGTLRGPETVAATGLVVAYGILTLTPPSLAALFDLTVFLEPDEPLHHAWRLARDVRERGYTPEEVLARRADRERDAARFVAVQRPYADLLIRFHGSPDGDPTRLTVELTLRQGEGAGPMVSAFEDLAAGGFAGVTFERAIIDEDGRRADRLLLDPALDSAAVAAAATLITAGLTSLRPVALSDLGQIRHGDEVRQSPTLVLAQLLIVRRLVGGRAA